MSKTVIPTGERALLDECIYGISASLAWHVDDTDITAQKVYGISLSKSLIHQWLESYCGGSVDEDFALSKARLWFTHETGMLLVNNQSVEALNALFSTLKAATIRGALELIISTHIAGDLPIIPADIFSQDEEAMLRIAIKSPPNKPAYRLVNHHNIPGCPKCYQSLIKDSQIQLSARRLTQCMGMSCRALLISLGA